MLLDYLLNGVVQMLKVWRAIKKNIAFLIIVLIILYLISYFDGTPLIRITIGWLGCSIGFVLFSAYLDKGK